MSESTDRFDTAVAAFDSRVKAVPTDAWSSQAPCEGWTARDVVGHVVRNYRSMAAQAGGVELAPEQAELGAGEDPVEAWTAASGQMKALISDPATSGAQVSGPAGPTTLEDAAGGIMSMDTHVHTWDLARAVGGDETLDPGIVAFTMALLEPIDEMIRMPGVFGPKVEAPAGADAQTQMLCFLGRRV